LGAMEVDFISKEGVPKEAIISVRAGALRRQAPASLNKPFRFSEKEAAGQGLLKFDIFQRIGRGYAVLKPGSDRYKVVLSEEHCMSCEVGIRRLAGGDAVARQPSGEDLSPARDSVTGVKDAKDYLENHGVLAYVQSMLQMLIKEKPADPYKFMTHHLQSGLEAPADEAANENEAPPPDVEKEAPAAAEKAFAEDPKVEAAPPPQVARWFAGAEAMWATPKEVALEDKQPEEAKGEDVTCSDEKKPSVEAKKEEIPTLRKSASETKGEEDLLCMLSMNLNSADKDSEIRPGRRLSAAEDKLRVDAREVLVKVAMAEQFEEALKNRWKDYGQAQSIRSEVREVLVQAALGDELDNKLKKLQHLEVASGSFAAALENLSIPLDKASNGKEDIDQIRADLRGLLVRKSSTGGLDRALLGSLQMPEEVEAPARAARVFEEEPKVEAAPPEEFDPEAATKDVAEEKAPETAKEEADSKEVEAHLVVLRLNAAEEEGAAADKAKGEDEVDMLCSEVCRLFVEAAQAGDLHGMLEKGNEEDPDAEAKEAPQTEMSVEELRLAAKAKLAKAAWSGELARHLEEAAAETTDEELRLTAQAMFAAAAENGELARHFDDLQAGKTDEELRLMAQAMFSAAAENGDLARHFGDLQLDKTDEDVGCNLADVLSDAVTGDKKPAETVSKVMPEETSEAAAVEASFEAAAVEASFEDIRLRLRGVLIEAATSDKLAKTIADVIDESNDAEKDMRCRLREVLSEAATSDKLAKTISDVIDERNHAEKDEVAVLEPEVVEGGAGEKAEAAPPEC